MRLRGGLRRHRLGGRNLRPVPHRQQPAVRRPEPAARRLRRTAPPHLRCSRLTAPFVSPLRSGRHWNRRLSTPPSSLSQLTSPNSSSDRSSSGSSRQPHPTTYG